MKKAVMTMVFLAAGSLFAAPAAKQDPVAEGCPAWQGVSAKNYVMGREITASDLRHRITVVVEADPSENLSAQFQKIALVLSMNSLGQNHFGENWETRTLPRDEIYLVSLKGGSKDVLETVTAALKPPKDADENVARAMAGFRSPSVPMYTGVTLPEAVNADGKYPFVYVMAPTGVAPVYKGVLTDKTLKEVKDAVTKERKKLASAEPKWVPFFGNVPEDKYPPVLVKALEKGKSAKMAPLAAAAKAIQKDIVSKDAEKAVTAQIVYDAIEQTRSDLVMRIKMEAAACPHRAVYDVQQLLKYWPSERKRVDVVLAKLKAMPEASKLAQMFCKAMAWADPNFTCKNAAEAKKIVAELNKMKKDLEKLKESKVVVVQNGAQLMDVQVDELIAVIQSRVPEK